MRVFVPLAFLFLAACPAPPDDSCASDGERTTVRVTIEAEGAEVGDLEFNVAAFDCMEDTTEAAAVVGEAFDMEVPKTSELTIKAYGPWGDHDSGGVGGDCYGEVNLASAGEDAVTEVTVVMTCETLD